MSTPSPSADRNLIFGLLALRMDFVSREQFLDVLSVWMPYKSTPLAQILRERGLLTERRARLLDELVEEHIDFHGGDPRACLSALHIEPAMRAELVRLADAEVQAGIATLPPNPAKDASKVATPAMAVPSSCATGAAIVPNGVRFRRLREHARGGLGEVFVALDEQLNREVALKEIQERFADDDDARTRFVREAEITGKLEHPGVVPVYGLGTHADGRPFYAMRFIRGETMEEAISRFHKADEASRRDPGERSLALRELLGRFIAVCNAVAYAHSRGIIHRDLKPANAMLGEYGETLVVDWGLAKTVNRSARTLTPQPSLPRRVRGSKDSESKEGPLTPPSPSLGEGGEGNTHGGCEDEGELTRAGQVLGTPAYMPPEQASGRQDQVGTASDVFALGATLYCLLTGQAPYSGVDAVIHAALAEWVPARQRKRSVPAALEAVCIKAMAAKPEDRYATPRDLAEEVQRYLADEPVRAHAEPWHLRLGRWVRHHKGLVGSVAAFLVVGLTVAVAVNEQQLRGIAEGERTEAETQRNEADNQRNEADNQRKEAEKQRKLANRYLYFSRIGLAERAWQEADIVRMDELLDLTKAEHTGGEDFHDFERAYLLRLRQDCLSTFTTGTVTGPIYSMAFSPDGQHLAIAKIGGVVSVWDVRIGKWIRPPHMGGMLFVWDARLGKHVRRNDPHTEPITCAAFSPDGQRLASANREGIVKVWNTQTDKVILTLTGHKRNTRSVNSFTVNSVAFSPDGQRLASGSFDGTVKVWDARTGKENLTLKGHTTDVHSVAFSPDGQCLASTGSDLTVKVWDVRTGKASLTLRGHTGIVHSVAFSPDGQRVASGSFDGTVKIWDARTGKENLTLKGHTSSIYRVAFSPDGQRLASASHDGTVKVWDAWAGQKSLTLKGHTLAVTGLAFSPDGQRLASASNDRTVRIWDARSSQENLTLGGHEFKVSSVAFSPDGRRVASADEDKMVKIWDACTGQEILTLMGQTRKGGITLSTSSVAFSPDGQRLASAGSDQTVKVWDARSGQASLTLKGHTGHVTSVAFSPDGQLLASASGDQTVKVWDVRTGRVSLTLKGHTQSVTCVVFSPDGQRLASASHDQTVKVWDAQIGQESFTLKGHTHVVDSVVFSPDGQRLASASYDGSVKVWDARTGKASFTLKAHSVKSVAFSPDGQRLVSGTHDGAVKVWDSLTGQEIFTLKGHAGEVSSLAFSPDGQRLASASWDRTVKIWDATPVSEESNLQRQAISYFRFVAETVVLKDEMIPQIRQTPTLSDPAREHALAFTKDYREIAARLDVASWSVARWSWARPGAYALALRQGEAACRLEPESFGFLYTLSAAQYRNGQYAAALKTMTQRGGYRGNHPADLGFKSMAQFQLDRKAEAAATLGRLRRLMENRTSDREAEEVLKEAENVVEAKKP